MQTTTQQGSSLVQMLLIIAIGSIIVLASNEFLSHYFVRSSQTLAHWQQQTRVAVAASYIRASETKLTHRCGQVAPQFHVGVAIASRLSSVAWSPAIAASHGIPIDSNIASNRVLVTQALTPGEWLAWVAAGQTQLLLPNTLAITPGDAVLITDCQQTEIIKVAKVTSGQSERITLASAVKHTFASGAKIMPLKTRVWYLGRTDQPDQYALYVMDQRLHRHQIIPGLTSLDMTSHQQGVSMIIQAGNAQEQLWLNSVDLF